MILYVDESYDNYYFVVGGILTKSDHLITEANKSFRKHAKSFPMKIIEQRKVFTEFKSSIIDDSYPAIKRSMLKHINEFDCKIVYSYAYLNGKTLNQHEKEKIYIKLLSKIVNTINTDIVIHFDSFGKKDFEDKIKSHISKYQNVILIDNKDSLNSKGIQFADNICSPIRKHLSGVDSNNYYNIISSKVFKC